MIYLYSDVLFKLGGIETYLHALATRLYDDGIPFQIMVSEQEPAPFLDDLAALGVPIYRQRVVPGDRWQVRKRLLIRALAKRLQPGDWVFCVRWPMPQVYLPLVRAVHRRGARIAVSWALAPEFYLPPKGREGKDFNRAVAETDVVISVSHCTANQFSEVYGYQGEPQIVRYHNLEIFDEPAALPAPAPVRIGFIGRIDIHHKNLDRIIPAFAKVAAKRPDMELHLYGGGPDIEGVKALALANNVAADVILHGPYDYRYDLGRIISECHFFIYASRMEGGPCFSLLELLQAGRFVVASPVGGIPDIYEGYPDVGLLVPPDDIDAIASALEEAVRKLEAGEIDPAKIRARYEEEFHTKHAHKSWLSALGLDEQGTDMPGLS